MQGHQKAHLDSAAEHVSDNVLLRLARRTESDISGDITQDSVLLGKLEAVDLRRTLQQTR